MVVFYDMEYNMEIEKQGDECVIGRVGSMRGWKVQMRRKKDRVS